MSDFFCRKINKCLSDLIKEEKNIIESPIIVDFFLKTAELTKGHDEKILRVELIEKMIIQLETVVGLCISHDCGLLFYFFDIHEIHIINTFDCTQLIVFQPNAFFDCPKRSRTNIPFADELFLECSRSVLHFTLMRSLI